MRHHIIEFVEFRLREVNLWPFLLPQKCWRTPVRTLIENFGREKGASRPPPIVVPDKCCRGERHETKGGQRPVSRLPSMAGHVSELAKRESLPPRAGTIGGPRAACYLPKWLLQ